MHFWGSVRKMTDTITIEYGYDDRSFGNDEHPLTRYSIHEYSVFD